MNIVFMGTPDFAVPCLEALVNKGHSVLAAFTQPDKPKGRGYTMTPPPVKARAEQLGIRVYQPTTLKDGEAVKILRELNPELIAVVAYGKILPEEILKLPKYGCINVHGSLLPKYRGAAPIQWAVLNGEKTTGVTTMYMEKGLDTGDMLLKAETEIGQNETAGELHDRLSQIGAQLLTDTVELLERGEAVRIKQDDSLSCYASMLDKSMCAIDWTQSAQSVHNKVRGLYPWPVATAEIDGKRVKILSTRLSSEQGRAGEVLSLSPFTVACADGSVIIERLQPEGKKPMDAKAYLLGHRLELNSILG